MFKNIIILLRIPHWIKNIFLFVPLVFSKNLFNEIYLIDTLLAFVLFNFATSCVYVFNDIMDAEDDKQHPLKKYRPIASGNISKRLAWLIFAILLIVVSIWLTSFNLKFIFIVIAYIVLNILYSMFFKKIVLVDIFIIAAGFMLRILAGAYAIDVFVSSWLILTTLFVSLFLAVLKRRSELQLVNDKVVARKVLNEYSFEFINYITSISAAGVVICYALYSVSERTVAFFNTDKIVFTTIFVLFGIFRYIYLILQEKKGENIVALLFSDPPMIINSMLYLASIIYIIYFI